MENSVITRYNELTFNKTNPNIKSDSDFDEVTMKSFNLFSPDSGLPIRIEGHDPQ